MNSVQKQDKENINNTIEKEIAAIRQLQADLVSDKNFSSILDMLENASGRIILTGMGKSGIIATKIAASFNSTGTPSFFLHPAEASHGDMGAITRSDVVIAISNSGESKELANIINYCHRFSVPLVGITKNPESTLARNVDHLIKLPDVDEADTLGLAPTSSTTATLVLGDILTVALMARRRFTREDFQVCHPGGKLGAILQCAKDVMHKGDEMPLLPENVPLSDILLEMTRKRLGCVGFMNPQKQLTGIFTDGDLRRKMSPELFKKKGTELMHKDPVMLSENTLLADVLKLMKERKIPSVFITREKTPVGIIHLHDLLNLNIL